MCHKQKNTSHQLLVSFKNMTKNNQKNGGIASTYKSLDTEELFDIYFNRPIGYAWALLFKSLHIHPNVITIVSILMGAAAGYFF